MDVLRQLLVNENVALRSVRSFAFSDRQAIMQEHNAFSSSILQTMNRVLDRSATTTDVPPLFPPNSFLTPVRPRFGSAVVGITPREAGIILNNMTDLENFLNEREPIVPTAEQIARAVTRDVDCANSDTNCPICQERIETTGTELRQCHHRFHTNCINTWFTESATCPQCRNDIREMEE